MTANLIFTNYKIINLIYFGILSIQSSLCIKKVINSMVVCKTINKFKYF